MKLLLVLALLFSEAVLADGITRGDALRRREYQTSATVALFVDPTGSDTGTCTSTPLSLLTAIQAPQFIRSPRGSTLIR